MHRRSHTKATPVLVLRFWDLAPQGPEHEPATACDPTDLTDPTDRSDHMRWLAIPRALPWAGRGSPFGACESRNTKTRQRGALAMVRAEGAAHPSWRAGLFQAPDTAMPSALTPHPMGSHLRRLASDPTWGAARLGTDSQSRRARRSAREVPRLLPAPRTIAKRTEFGRDRFGDSHDAASARTFERPIVEQLVNVSLDLPLVTEPGDFQRKPPQSARHTPQSPAIIPAPTNSETTRFVLHSC